MEKMVAFVGLIVGSSVGGWLGGMFGIWGSMILGMIGAGLGFYFARKFLGDFLG